MFWMEGMKKWEEISYFNPETMDINLTQEKTSSQNNSKKILWFAVALLVVTGGALYAIKTQPLPKSNSPTQSYSSPVQANEINDSSSKSGYSSNESDATKIARHLSNSPDPVCRNFGQTIALLARMNGPVGDPIDKWIYQANKRGCFR